MASKVKIPCLLFLFTLFYIIAAHSQQEPQYTQYMYNTLSVNPAYAGSRESPSLIGLYRTQWVGIEGAPQTGQLSVHAPLGQRQYGIGLSAVADQFGPERDAYVNGAFSYPMQLSREITLRLGIMAGINFLEVDFNRLNPEHPEDLTFSGKLTESSPNIGTGAYLYTKDWFISLSVPALLETKFYDELQQSTAIKKPHFYLSGGYTFYLNNDLQLKPATMIKTVSGGPISVDLSTNFVYMDRFHLGMAYRFGAAVSGLAGFQVSDGLFIGYSYDRDTNRLGNYNSGSHEIFVRFDFFGLGGRCRCYL